MMQTNKLYSFGMDFDILATFQLQKEGYLLQEARIRGNTLYHLRLRI